MTLRFPGPGALASAHARGMRRSLLAVALAVAAGGTASPAFALGCVYERTGDNVLLSRNASETATNSYYGYGSSNPSLPFDATGLDRLELRNCLVNEIAHGTLVTDRPIEIVIDNGPPGAPGPRDAYIDLSRRFVNQVAGSTSLNRIVVNGGRILSTTGPDGAVPLETVFNGGAFGGGFSAFDFSPRGRIRDGDSLIVNSGSLTNVMRLGGGADSARFTGGDALSNGFALYGDGGDFSQAALNTFGNRFDDTFVLTGGIIDQIFGDSGDVEAFRDASGNYTRTSAPAGNDHFILDGAQVRLLSGDDGDDRLDLRGNSTLTEFRGGYGSDTVDVALGASLANVRRFEGDSGTGTALDGFRDRSTDVDTIRFRGQHFVARSDRGTQCPDGVTTCPSVSIRGFERIELLDGARMSLFDYGYLDGSSFGDALDADSTTIYVGAGSTLAARRSSSTIFPEARLRTSVVNDGVLDLGQDATGDVLHVAGDWSGTGRVLMATVLGGDTSATDRLRIDGNATGRTVLDIMQAPGSTGAQTVDGILVVDTRGTSTADAFVLAAPITTANGLWQYRLERASSGPHAGRWVLTSSVPTAAPPTTPPPATPPPTTPPPTTPPPTGTPDPGNMRLLAPVVTTAAVSSSIAQALFVDGLADAGARSLAVREGGTEAAVGHAASPVWMRLRGDQLETFGDRFGQDVRRIGLQAGVDLQRGERVVRGVMARVAQAEGDVQDRLRPTVEGFATPLSASVGEVRLQAFTAGGYQTLAFGGGYSLDLTAEAGALRGRLSAFDGSSTRSDGWAGALSGTLARGYVAGGWDWRPQVQLIAAHTRLDGLEGGVASERLAQDSLRARLGLHASTRGQGPSRLYAVANVWRDLREADATVFYGGSDSTRVSPGMARSWAELGIGLSHVQGMAAWYVDLRGEQGLGSGDRNAVSAQMGLNLRW